MDWVPAMVRTSRWRALRSRRRTAADVRSTADGWRVGVGVHDDEAGHVLRCLECGQRYTEES